MIVKWVLLVFGLAAIALVVIGKVIAFLNPPRPGRARPAALRRVERALRWTVLLPALLALLLLGLTLGGWP